GAGGGRAAGGGLETEWAVRSRGPAREGAALGGDPPRRVPAVRPRVPRDVDPGRVAAQQPTSRVRRIAGVHRKGRPLPPAGAPGFRPAATRVGSERAGTDALTERRFSGRRRVAALAALAAVVNACAS